MSMRELLRFDTQGRLRGRSVNARRAVLRDVYLTRLANAFWMNNHRGLQGPARARSQGRFEDRFWRVNRRAIGDVMLEALRGFLAQAGRELAAIAHICNDARASRPAPERDRQRLVHTRHIDRRVQPHEDAILHMAHDHAQRALAAFARRDPRRRPILAATHGVPVPGSDPLLARDVQLLLRQPFAQPTTLARWEPAWRAAVERSVRRRVLRAAWAQHGAPHALPEALLLRARPLAAAVDADVRAGLAALRAAPPPVGVAAVGPRWIAWTYARARATRRRARGCALRRRCRMRVRWAESRSIWASPSRRFRSFWCRGRRR